MILIELSDFLLSSLTTRELSKACQREDLKAN